MIAKACWALVLLLVAPVSILFIGPDPSRVRDVEASVKELAHAVDLARSNVSLLVAAQVNPVLGRVTFSAISRSASEEEMKKRADAEASSRRIYRETGINFAALSREVPPEYWPAEKAQEELSYAETNLADTRTKMTVCNVIAFVLLLAGIIFAALSLNSRPPIPPGSLVELGPALLLASKRRARNRLILIGALALPWLLFAVSYPALFTLGYVLATGLVFAGSFRCSRGVDGLEEDVEFRAPYVLKSGDQGRQQAKKLIDAKLATKQKYVETLKSTGGGGTAVEAVTAEILALQAHAALAGTDVGAPARAVLERIQAARQQLEVLRANNAPADAIANVTAPLGKLREDLGAALQKVEKVSREVARVAYSQ